MTRLFLLLFFFFFSTASTNAQSLIVPFHGELVDESLTPISGVFPMIFHAYSTQDASEAIWTEEHFISVLEGQYQLDLGTQTPIPTEQNGNTVFVAVELGSFGEVTRQEIIFAASIEEENTAPTISALVYAHIADHAIEAESAVLANDCETLGGRSAEELDRFDELNEAMRELRQEIEDATETRIGSQTQLSDRVGGNGGSPYNVSCPSGHVVTGIRGRAGALIDAFELICSPIQ